MASRLSQAKKLIKVHLKESGQEVLRYDDLRCMLRANAKMWHLRKDTTVREFIDFLEGENLLSHLECEAYPLRTAKRYLCGSPSLEQVAMSLEPQGYLSHGTALFWHGLLNEAAKRVILNHEQSPKPTKKGTMVQAAIDRAFAKGQRSSQLIYRCEAGEIQVINGKSTGNYGVVSIRDPKGNELRVTELERTLVDCAVRPGYAQGILQVLNAYRLALPKLDMALLIKALRKVNHAYPYHQSIGFLLEKAGASPDLLSPLKQMGLNHDFYVDHEIKDPCFNTSWRVHYPRELDDV
jgi:predicted transcriptional regulator of viral defense system